MCFHRLLSIWSDHRVVGSNMLIGFTGNKGAGKDTVGEYLVNNNFQRVAFADPMKLAVANLFDITVEEVDNFKENDGNTIDLVEVALSVVPAHPGKLQYDYTFTWREFLQRFGTDMARNTFGHDFWVDQWQATAEPLIRAGMNVVVTDVRFENEAQRIQSFEGYIIQISRPGYESDGHESEMGLDSKYVDAMISNEGTKSELYETLEAFLDGALTG